MSFTHLPYTAKIEDDAAYPEAFLVSAIPRDVWEGQFSITTDTAAGFPE
jgi:hypothetical protein